MGSCRAPEHPARDPGLLTRQGMHRIVPCGRLVCASLPMSVGQFALAVILPRGKSVFVPHKPPLDLLTLYGRGGVCLWGPGVSQNAVSGVEGNPLSG